MKTLVATMIEGGQITLPDEVRRALQLRSHDRLAFTIDESEVRLVPLTLTLDDAFGSVEPISDLSIDE